MTTQIIACRTIADELELARRETGCDLLVRWVDSGLHNRPDRLRTALQQALDEVTGTERVLMAFGFCGNAVVGLATGDFELVVPRVDDCISLMLGSTTRRQAISDEKGTYFLTRGYLEHESNIWSEYQAFAAKRGKALADSIYATLLEHYRRLGIIDTGAYELEPFVECTGPIAETFHLEREVLPGTTRYLQKLLTGPWDDEFIVVGPRSVVSFDRIDGS
jgi:hypothetical protein